MIVHYCLAIRLLFIFYWCYPIILKAALQKAFVAYERWKKSVAYAVRYIGAAEGRKAPCT